LKIKLTEEELKELIILHDAMELAPFVILYGKDHSQTATNATIQYWNNLSKKYDFDPHEIIGIDEKTGEVILK